jgi:hypothetical protein
MSKDQPFNTAADQIPALLPRGTGRQFVVYGDACSGVPGARHERTFAEVNAIVRRLYPSPEFIVFLGDEISGLTPHRNRLLAQWRHWLDAENGLARPPRDTDVACDRQSHDLRRHERAGVPRSSGHAVQRPA